MVKKLEDYTLKELQSFVRGHNKGLSNKNKIRGYTKLNKKQLIKFLNKRNFKIKIQ